MNDIQAETLAARNAIAVEEQESLYAELQLAHHKETALLGQFPWINRIERLVETAKRPRQDMFRDFSHVELMLVAKLAIVAAHRIRLEFNQGMLAEHERAAKAENRPGNV